MNEHQTKKMIEQMEALRKAGLTPFESFRHTVKDAFTNILTFCEEIDYKTANNFYTTFDEKHQGYNYTFLRSACNHLGMEKMFLKKFLRIEDKLTQEEELEEYRALKESMNATEKR